MATCNLFEEDEVYCETQGKGINIGLILENAEYVSSSEDEDGDNERLQKGTVRVAWHPSGKDSVLAEQKLHLADRSLMPGDIVRRLIQGQETQCGFVTDVDIQCHAHVLGSKKFIYNIDSKCFQPLQKFYNDEEVLFDSWLGRVENVIIDVIIVFQDGAKCKVVQEDLFNFEDVSFKRSKHSEFGCSHNYPGQELKGLMDNLTEAVWIHSTPRYCSRMANKKGRTFTVRVVVEKIVTRSVDVQWVFRGYQKTDNSSETVGPPPRLISGDDVDKLQALDWYSYCNIQLGDRMTYIVKNDDLISEVPPKKAFDPKELETKNSPIVIFTALDNKSQSNLTNAGPNVEKNTDEVDDGDLEDDDFESESDEKFGASSGRCAGTKKKKVKDMRVRLHKSGKVGQNAKLCCSKKKLPKERQIKPDDVVEVEIAFTKSWVTVMWQDGSQEKDIPSFQLFPVHHLDDFEFFPGDFVLPNIDLDKTVDYGVVAKVDHHERTCFIRWFNSNNIGKAVSPTLVEDNYEMSVYDIKDHPDYKYRPGDSVVRVGAVEPNDVDGKPTLQTIGQILHLDPCGSLIIKWADSSISQHYPQEIFVISDEADNFSEESWETDDEGDSSETWETESEQEILGEAEDEKAEKIEALKDILCEHKQELDSLLNRAETALMRLQNHLNNLGVAVHSPDCFHDILRIYRSCHDLDKILESSFFNDPELQSLIAQVKAELRRDKSNKISRHLSLLFDTWSKNLATGSHENSGGKTISVGPLQDCDTSGQKEGSASPEAQYKCSENSCAVGSKTIHAALAACSANDIATLNLKKEISEPALNQTSKQQSPGSRRLSDPLNESAIGGSSKHKKKSLDALVGENCVSKAAKRVKSDGYDDSGCEVKKSRDESKSANQFALELCSLICQNLQKQILSIHEEVNKRTSRMLAADCVHQKDVSELNNKEDQSGGATQQGSGTKISENAHHTTNLSPEALKEVIMEEETTSHKSPIIIMNGQVNGQEAVMETNSEKLTDQGCSLVDKSSQNQIDSVLHSESSSSLELEALPVEMKSLPVTYKGFEMCGDVLASHKYVNQKSQPVNSRNFKSAIKKELKLFQTSLPDGIFVKGFESRLDLYSVMILGPKDTPYEDAVFLFDFMLPNDYPLSPPLCFYHSFCSDKLNPNLYEDGKVCVSLLGTWSGKGTEVWTSKSNLLQVLLSIQGLILVPEPYYNEAGYEKQRGTQVGHENSRMYNEMAIIKTIQSLHKMCIKLPVLFQQEIYHYLKAHGPRMIARLRDWMAEGKEGKKEPVDTECCIVACANLLSNTNLTCDSKVAMESVTAGNRAVDPETCSYLQGSSGDDCTDVLTTIHKLSTKASSLGTDSGIETTSVSETGDQDQTAVVQGCNAKSKLPQFPLFPMSKGFRLTLQKTLNLYEKALQNLELPS